MSKAYILGFEDGLAGKEPWHCNIWDYHEGYKAGQKEAGRS